MPRFQRKPFVVDAVQWHKPGDHPAVEAREPCIFFDAPRNYFYVQRFDDEMMKSRVWMAVDPMGETAHKYGGILSFAFYKLNDGNKEPIAEHRDLYERYAAHAGYETEPVAIGLVPGAGSNLPVYPGDWIINHPDGKTFTVLNDKAFTAEYDPVSE
jgi:hypothetical protein